MVSSRSSITIKRLITKKVAALLSIEYRLFFIYKKNILPRNKKRYTSKHWSLSKKIHITERSTNPSRIPYIGAAVQIDHPLTSSMIPTNEDHALHVTIKLPTLLVLLFYMFPHSLCCLTQTWYKPLHPLFTHP